MSIHVSPLARASYPCSLSLASRYLPPIIVYIPLHCAFDLPQGRGWLWLPMENDILKRLYEHVTNKRKSDINKVVTDIIHSLYFILNIVQIYGRKKRFSYRLIAFQDMCFPLHRSGYIENIDIPAAV